MNCGKQQLLPGFSYVPVQFGMNVALVMVYVEPA